ncbi:hypothetical protein GC093_04280 [Paenibacillus sp. LMG 31456]|uniref:Uncharacterized protein n=1 Tax=Paenibacillus foliorum TaxID=2654974 RepID=A0A972K027_9BACL|nr:hypothetical protein [Paenibacillus foliorum]NOU92453.1 hypothetical protein [Paenibacillus foliorum]
MKHKLFIWMLLMLLFGSGSFTAMNNALAAVSDSTGMRLPEEISLTANSTPIYDEMDGDQLYDAAPQTVQVAGAENNWDRKLLGGSKVWFQIKTSNEVKWVLLQNPQFEETYYNYVVLMQEESFYSSRSTRGLSLGTISPQVVRVVYTDGEYYLIETWLGYKWIHPKPPNIQQAQYYGRNSSGLSAYLRTITPMFRVPDAGSEVAGVLSPQDVQAKVTLNNNEWLYIDTWEGKRWVNTRISYPPDLRSEERSLTLTDSAIAYEHPDKQARELGRLTPQKVTVFEHGGGWHHIHSDWLGDCWIYQLNPEDDPAAYTPPTVVISKVITGVKKSHQYELGAGWRNSPFDLRMVVLNGERINPEGFFTIGQEVGLRFSIQNVSKDELELNPLTSFEVEINRQLDSGDGSIKPELVWSGKILASKSVFKSGESEELTFIWDQKDSDGKQVPFGNYSVQIKLPMTIDYTKAGASEQGQAQTAMLTHFPLRISAP